MHSKSLFIIFFCSIIAQNLNSAYNQGPRDRRPAPPDFGFPIPDLPERLFEPCYELFNEKIRSVFVPISRISEFLENGYYFRNNTSKKDFETRHKTS